MDQDRHAIQTIWPLTKCKCRDDVPLLPCGPMCGICGSTNDPNGTSVGLMSAKLAHRGPDDVGLETSGAVTLGARRLSIIDVAGGHQPMVSDDGSVIAVLNGEVYNYRSLQENLRQGGHKLRSNCDTEVLVHLYEEMGPQMVHALEGMYAFAIWDSVRQRLLLARDRFGEKPLFWVQDGDDLLFASELSALSAGSRTAFELDPEAMDAAFVYGYVPGPRTMARSVHQLEPGSLLLWARGQATVSSYWVPPKLSTSEVESGGSLYAETASLLRASVASRMIADVPIGVLLSGGLDSSLVAVIAAEESTHRIQTFSVGYGVAAFDETLKARAVAEQIGSEHQELRLTDAAIAELAPGLLAGLDQPLADQALLALHAVCGLASQHVKVVIGGEGADELFGGYPRYRWLARAARIDAMLPKTIGRLSSRALAGLPGQARRLADVVRPQRLHERHLDWVTAPRRSLRADLYGERLLPVVRSGVLEANLGSRLGDTDGDVAGSLMLLDQRHWLPDDVLAKADRAGMLASIEVRTPFLNRSLAEFGATVPSRRHLKEKGKSLLRGVMAEVAPSMSIPPKTAFRVPAAAWLRGPLRSCLVETIEDGRLFDEKWFSRDATRRLADRHFAGDTDASATLWHVLALGLWFERFTAS